MLLQNIKKKKLVSPVGFPGSWRPGTGHIWLWWCVIGCSRMARFAQCRWDPSSHQLVAAPEFSPPLHVLHLPPPAILWRRDPNLYPKKNQRGGNSNA